MGLLVITLYIYSERPEGIKSGLMKSLFVCDSGSGDIIIQDQQCSLRTVEQFYAKIYQPEDNAGFIPIYQFNTSFLAYETSRIFVQDSIDGLEAFYTIKRGSEFTIPGKTTIHCIYLILKRYCWKSLY